MHGTVRVVGAVWGAVEFVGATQGMAEVGEAGDEVVVEGQAV
jgi:hypothetical protein